MRKTVWILLVVAALAAGCMGGGGEEAATTASAPQATSTVEEPPAPEPPSGFSAEAAPFAVELTWEPPAEEVERYELFRDGARLAIQPGSASTYTDEDVIPGQPYDYQIASATGEVVTTRVKMSTETPVPALRAARVEGTFNVTNKVASKSGYGTYTPTGFGWVLRPRCAEGPCDVRWRDLHVKRLRTVLKRSGPRYRGDFSGQFIIECAGSPVTSAVELDLRVDKARVIDGEWRATLLVGTLDHSEAAQLGCGYSEAQLTVRARLVN